MAGPAMAVAFTPVSTHAWFRVLATLPVDEGECHATTLSDEPLAGWRQVWLVLGDGISGLRVITAMYDPTGQPGMISDLVATDSGHRQESVGARFESDGRIHGTHWVTDGEHHTPRPITEGEANALRELATTLRQRCASDGAA